jgi:hypothetical protein
MTTTHSVAPEDIMACLDGELSASEAQTASAHLKDCAQCAMVAEQFRATSRMLSRWDVEAAPAALEDSVKKLAGEAAAHRVVVKSGSNGFRRRRLLVIGSGAVAVMALLVVAVFFSSNRKPLRAFVDEPARGYIQPGKADKERQFDRLDQFARLHESMGAAAKDEVVRATSVNGTLGQLEASSMPAPMIARTATLVVRVKNVEASRSTLDLILARHHGYFAQLNVTSPEYGSRGFQASLRIPAAELLSAVGEIKGLGRLENESQSGEEVTRQHADLGARLKTARETEERFRAILQQRTGKIADVLEVERSIASVRGEIEAMEAEQKTLEHRVDFASVEIQLSEEYKAQLGSPADSVSTRIYNAFVAGYRNATETLLGFLLFFEEYGPSLMIWLVVLALPILLVWRRYKRVRSTI